MAPASHDVGDREASLFATLATKTERARLYISRRLPHDIQRFVSPEDVLQEVWVTAFEDFARANLVGTDAVERWLMTVVKRRLVDAIRTARRLKRGGGHRIVAEADTRSASFVALFDSVAPRGRTPSAEMSAKETELTIRFAVASLPGNYRQVLELYYIDGKCRANIAEELRTTIGAVNSLLFRARTRLRERVGTGSDFFSGHQQRSRARVAP